MALDPEIIRRTATQYCSGRDCEQGLLDAFVQVCEFLCEHQDSLSWRSANKPSLAEEKGIHILAERYFDAYSRSDYPNIPGTVPDEIVSIIMRKSFGYSKKRSERIKTEHLQVMAAENCVGALLERYLDSVLRPYGWSWCCGNFVKAIDFIKRNEDDGSWLTLQIKNRDNSENSSSSAIRQGTSIEKWFRSFSKTGKTNWDHLPHQMQGVGLNEEGFIRFVEDYLDKMRPPSLE